jgi:Kef-type K+ transport system membrane component KefB
MINPFVTTVTGQCPGGFCDIIVKASEAMIVLLLVLAFLFGVTLIPPLFSWKTSKPDSRKRIYFAMFACVMFYLWLVVLGVHSLYCFGFVAHLGTVFSFNSSQIDNN